MDPEEKAMWEHEWVKCTKHLNQWDVLSRFAHAMNNAELKLECSWKFPAWTELKNIADVYGVKGMEDIPDVKKKNIKHYL